MAAVEALVFFVFFKKSFTRVGVECVFITGKGVPFPLSEPTGDKQWFLHRCGAGNSDCQNGSRMPKWQVWLKSADSKRAF
jgi:hypothetical protein